MNAQLQCEVKESCEPDVETLVLCLSDQTNAHAEMPTQSIEGSRCENYDYKVCCSDKTEDGVVLSQLSNQCSGKFSPVAYLHAMTNSHGARPKYGVNPIVSADPAYTIPVCLSAIQESKCEFKQSKDEGCVLAMSGVGDNSHFSSCEDATEEYESFISCKVTSDIDGDLYAADQDCDDTIREINPGATEVGDGIDNDCDGTIDGDDTQLQGDAELPDGWYQLSDVLDGDQFSGFDAEGITTITQDTGERVFQTTRRGTRALVSKKIALAPRLEGRPAPNYIASVKSTCDINNVNVLIAFDNEKSDNREVLGQWGFITQEILDSEQVDTAPDVPEGIIRTLPQEAKADDKWVSIIIITDEVNCFVSQPLLELKGAMSPTEYNDIHTPREFDQEFGVTLMQASSCCPEGSCWNGFACISNMRTDTFTKEGIAGEAEYRCIDGNWVFSKMLYDWNHQEQGSCPDADQCFVLNSLGETSLETPQEGEELSVIDQFYQGKTPLCVNNGDSLFDHYCLKGNWTSRTRFLAQKLVEVAGENPYTISCGSYRDLFLDEGDKPGLLGGTQDQASGQRAQGPGRQQPDAGRSVCFNEVNNPTLIADEENTCINNVCVLKYTVDDGEKVAFATSLNRDLADVNSFLQTLNVPADKVNQVCPDQNPENPSDFVRCDGIEEFAPGARLWYSAALNAVIYGPDGVLVNPTRWESFLDDPFGTILSLFEDEPELSENSKFVQNAQNLYQVYLLEQEDRRVRAVLEKQGIDNAKEALVAEFEGFSTPICEYLRPDRMDFPSAAKVDAFEAVAGESPFVCTATDDLRVQRIEAVGGGKEFWPQLTNRLRINVTDGQE
ncbi:putative metal-binding motif-containing protein [Candidatus Woesearchaeota archaeon]|nr:putative metal-binding motif-containing protein [Candidatus Woesearchaeota archaeon]